MRVKVTKNYWIGIGMVLVAILLATFGRTENPCQTTGVGCASMNEYLIDNIGSLLGAIIGMLGLIIVISGIILEEKK